MYLYVCIYISYTYTLHIFMRIIHVCVIHVYTCTILYIQSTYILHIYIYIGVFLAYKYKCINHAHIHRGIGVGSCLSFEEIVIGVFRVYTCPHIWYTNTIHIHIQSGGWARVLPVFWGEWDWCLSSVHVSIYLLHESGLCTHTKGRLSWGLACFLRRLWLVVSLCTHIHTRHTSCTHIHTSGRWGGDLACFLRRLWLVSFLCIESSSSVTIMNVKNPQNSVAL